MISEKITILECREGDILADDAFNLYGVMLASRGTLLNDYLISKLNKNGIREITIWRKLKVDEDSNFNIKFQKSYYNKIVQTKKLFQDLLKGKQFEHERILSITDEIYNYKDLSSKIIKSLLKMKSIDQYTYYHSVNVAFYCMLISNWMRLPENKVKKAVQAGFLHDLGKTRIPNDILNKKGILTREEFEVIKDHTVLGYELVNKIEGIDHEVKLAVLLHHERMDGSGYPYHYKPEHKDFNLYSKIVAVADVFDAMTSDRIYKKKSTPFEVFEMFQTVGLSMLDTKIIKFFIERLAVYLIGNEVLLSSGELGKIVYIPLHNVTCPIVQVSSGYVDMSLDNEVKIIRMI